MYKIFSKIEFCLEHVLPFVVYRKPLENEVHGIFQHDSDYHKTFDFQEKGFVFAPFDLHQNAILIKPDEVLTAVCEPERAPAVADPLLSDFGKEAYLGLIAKSLQEMKAGALKKVVLSRKIALFTASKPTGIFKTILAHYPEAFCYILFHPAAGLWYGASPEPLLYRKERELQTTALAATLPVVDSVPPVWKPKERAEQAMVVEDIRKQLTPLLEKLQVGETTSVKAGNLWHLQTLIKGSVWPGTPLEAVIRALHPTPAVCGIPTEKAKAFIEKHENYPRTFYTGFLGELNLKAPNETTLFVNLRCMKLQAHQAIIFVGGGITVDSDPEKEWIETQHKSKTLLSIL